MKVGRGWGTAAGAGVVTLIDMRAAELMGPGRMISQELFESLAAGFEAGEQALVHVATRGSATAVVCQECSFKSKLSVLLGQPFLAPGCRFAGLPYLRRTFGSFG